jgi:hypothetical protein
MTTHFPRMRRWMLLTAVLLPVLTAVMWVCLVAGMLWVAVASGMAAFGLFCVFPFSRMSDRVPQSLTAVWTNRLATLLFVLWLIQFPEFSAFVERVTSGGPIWDWRLMAAVSLWSLRMIHLNWRMVVELTDAQIESYYQAG